MLLESTSCTLNAKAPEHFQTHACAIAEMLTWPTGAPVSPALSAQLHFLAEPALLKALVQQALPVQSSGTPVDSMQQASTVRSLCRMLQGITTIPALCQKALIFTAGPADFVQRLWSSYLKVSHRHLPPCSLPCFYNAYVKVTQAINLHLLSLGLIRGVNRQKLGSQHALSTDDTEHYMSVPHA